MTAFIARTPLKLVLVDRWRHRWLDRSRLAWRLASVEIGLIAVLGVWAARGATNRWFWVPLAAAAPLVGVELWFDMQSRGRRLIPELTGAIGIGSVVASIVLAADRPAAMAVGLWVVVSARACAAIPYARTQVFRAHSRPVALWPSNLAQVAALAAVAGVWVANAVPFAPVAAICAVACFNIVAVRGPVRRAVAIGMQQMAFGIAVVMVTAIAVLV